jgi:hypothetical protein
MYVKNNNPSYEAFALIQESADEEERLYKTEMLKRAVNYRSDEEKTPSLRKKER